VISIRVGGDPALRFLKGGPSCWNGLSSPTELHLAARSLEEHDELGGNLHRRVPAQILLDKRQSEIETGGDARGSADRSIADIERIGLNPDFGKRRRELIGDRPMSGDMASVQEASGGEQKGAAADRSVASRPGRLAAQPSDKRRRRKNVGRVQAAGDKERINPIGRRIVNCPVWKETDARGASHRPLLRADHNEPIARFRNLQVRFGEHIERAADIEQLHARHSDNRNRCEPSARVAFRRKMSEFV
jgi:hypothetical protein